MLKNSSIFSDAIRQREKKKAHNRIARERSDQFIVAEQPANKCSVIMLLSGEMISHMQFQLIEAKLSNFRKVFSGVLCAAYMSFRLNVAN